MTAFGRKREQAEQARHTHLLQQLKRESKVKRQAEQAQAAAQRPYRELSRHLPERQPSLSLSRQPSEHHA